MIQNLNQLFSINVRSYREAAGLSQEKLAEQAGLHRTYVGQVERGEANVTLEVVQALATALGTDPGTLLVNAGKNG